MFNSALAFAVISVATASRATADFFSATARTRVNKNSNQSGTTRMQTAAMVQLRAEAGSSSQPKTKRRKVAGSTKLLRKLSRIFHCDTREMGFDTLRPVSSGTRVNSQLVICQSPRSQRCLRRLYARRLADHELADRKRTRL